MIDNFDKFKREFKEGEFYFIQLIKRSKDNPGVRGINGNNHARCIKEYSIYTQEDLDKRKQEMIDIATVCNARIYIHPARRNIYEVRRLMSLLIGENICYGKHNLSGIYRHACGLSKGTEKLWIIDIDNPQKMFTHASFRKALFNLRPVGEKVLQKIETVNGFHFITTPFDLKRFKELYPEIDVHKNNPTLLYYKNI